MEKWHTCRSGFMCWLWIKWGRILIFFIITNFLKFEKFGRKKHSFPTQLLRLKALYHYYCYFKLLGPRTLCSVPNIGSICSLGISRVVTVFFCLVSDEALGSDQGVLVHCLAGVSRSVTITVAYLMQTKKLTLNAAYDYVKTCKPNISPNFNFMGQLLEFQRSLGHVLTCSCGGDQVCTCSDITRLISGETSQT